MRLYAALNLHGLLITSIKDPMQYKLGLELKDYHIGGIGRGYIGNRTHEQFYFWTQRKV